MYTRTCLQRYITTCTQINAWQNASTEKEAALPSRATSFKSTMPARLPQPVTVSKQFQQRHTTPGKWTTRSMASEPRNREREREWRQRDRKNERKREKQSQMVNIWQGILHDVNMPAATSSRLSRTLWIYTENCGTEIYHETDHLHLTIPSCAEHIWIHTQNEQIVK